MSIEIRKLNCPNCGCLNETKWHKPPKKTKEGYLIVEGECPNCGLEYKGHGHKKDE